MSDHVQRRSCASATRAWAQGSLAFLVLLVALLGSAPASRAAQPPVLVAGPVGVHAYSLLVLVSRNDVRGGGALVQIRLSRRESDGSEQSHTFEVRRGVHFSASRDLSAARVRADLPGYGRVNLTLTGARQRRGGCFHHAHTGVARGRLTLIPGGSYFSSIALTSLPAFLGVPRGCLSSVHTARAIKSTPILMGAQGTRLPHGPSIVWSASSDLSVTSTRRGTRVRVKDTLTVPALPASALMDAPDLSRATLQAVGPFLTGTAHYTASAPAPPAMGLTCRHTSGTLSGTLKAMFDTPAPLSLAGPSFSGDLEC